MQQEGSWYLDKRGALRFVLYLGVWMTGFNAVFLRWLSPSEFFETYLCLNAEASAVVLQVLGDDASATGTAITSPRFSVNIQRGCEASQVSAFFVFAVLAWPASVSLWRRVTGIALGTLLLVIFNLVRIVSLYCTGVYFPSAFEAMHVDVWPPVFMVLALFLWVMWMRWITESDPVKADVAV